MTDSTPTPYSEPESAPPFEDLVAMQTEASARAAFGRYRIMAWVTGSMLLLLTFEMIMRYLVRGGESFLGPWVAIVHGWIYVVYLLAVFHLWSFMRWDFPRMILLLVAGVIPVLSFVMEPRAKTWFEQDLPERVAMSVRLATAMRDRAEGGAAGA